MFRRSCELNQRNGENDCCQQNVQNDCDLGLLMNEAVDQVSYFHKLVSK